MSVSVCLCLCVTICMSTRAGVNVFANQKLDKMEMFFFSVLVCEDKFGNEVFSVYFATDPT